MSITVNNLTERSINETAFNGFVLHRTINLHKWLNLSSAADMATACGKYQTAFVAHRQGDKVILVLSNIKVEEEEGKEEEEEEKHSVIKQVKAELDTRLT
ncbi:hypothetical protein HZH66_000999 [Vespula vulgaris]|uniref:Uncharacterized protein n=1 Tax=Vespula vulgaris TaxID=7454 RepID=A0A834KSL5_VESVU|nr:hypothetical protein HZH66_000999 [Vespula vulgaris]